VFSESLSRHSSSEAGIGAPISDDMQQLEGAQQSRSQPVTWQNAALLMRGVTNLNSFSFSEVSKACFCDFRSTQPFTYKNAFA